MKFLLLVSSVVCLSVTALATNGPKAAISKSLGLRCPDFSGEYTGQCTVSGIGSGPSKISITQDEFCSNLSVAGESFPMNGKRTEESGDEHVSLKKLTIGKISKDGKSFFAKYGLIIKVEDKTGRFEGTTLVTRESVSSKLTANGELAVSCNYKRK